MATVVSSSYRLGPLRSDGAMSVDVAHIMSDGTLWEDLGGTLLSGADINARVAASAAYATARTIEIEAELASETSIKTLRAKIITRLQSLTDTQLRNTIGLTNQEITLLRSL